MRSIEFVSEKILAISKGKSFLIRLSVRYPLCSSSANFVEHPCLFLVLAMDVPKLARKLVAESSISCGSNDTKSESPSMFCTETVSVDCDEDAAFCKALAEVERTRNRMLARASKQIATSDAMCRSSPQRTVFGNNAYNCSAQGLVGIKEAEMYQQDAKSNSDIVAQDVADAIAMLIDDEDQAAYPRKCEYDGIKSQLSFEADTKFNVGDYYCEPASAFSRGTSRKYNIDTVTLKFLCLLFFYFI